MDAQTLFPTPVITEMILRSSDIRSDELCFQVRGGEYRGTLRLQRFRHAPDGSGTVLTAFSEDDITIRPAMDVAEHNSPHSYRVIIGRWKSDGSSTAGETWSYAEFFVLDMETQTARVYKYSDYVAVCLALRAGNPI